MTHSLKAPEGEKQSADAILDTSLDASRQVRHTFLNPWNLYKCDIPVSQSLLSRMDHNLLCRYAWEPVSAMDMVGLSVQLESS
jgi:hypothetical protein